jgi:hypothetical protein
MTRDDLNRWVDAYEAAWRSGDGVDELFTADARYRSAPFLEPYAGIDAIEEFCGGKRTRASSSRLVRRSSPWRATRASSGST